MSILTSLFSGVSGLNAFGNALSVVSNNIANLNTTGFKDSTVSFADIVGSSLSGGGAGSEIGRGVFVNDISTQFVQGSFETTGDGLDMAIDGEGFFLVQEPSGAQFYTRAGIFSVDNAGLVADPSGNFLMGFQADATGALTGQIGTISLTSAVFPPFFTTSVDLVANLDSRDTIPAAFTAATAATTSNFSTSISVFDSLGNDHLLSVYFRKSVVAAAGNTWEWFAVVDAADSLSGVTEIQAQGTLDFTTDGELDTESAITYPLASGGFDFAGGATTGQAVTFDFGTSITTNSGSGLDGVTQFGSISSVINQIQDGYASGSLQSVSINGDGLISGIFTNGRSRNMGQIILARFNNPKGLSKLGGNLYGVTSSSGQPIIGVAGAAGTGSVLSSSLELSNVDLAQQFVKMIEFQRGFQASTRIITTADEMLQELVNLKR